MSLTYRILKIFIYLELLILRSELLSSLVQPLSRTRPISPDLLQPSWSGVKINNSCNVQEVLTVQVLGQDWGVLSLLPFLYSPS